MADLSKVVLAYCYDELFDAGVSPDGDRIEGQRVVIEAETPDGFRWRHSKTFMTSRLEVDPDGFCHWVNNVAVDMKHAQHLVDRINAHLVASGELDPEHWHSVQGAYGSAGWDDLAELELEAAEARL